MTLRIAAHTAGGVEDVVGARLNAGALWSVQGPGPLDVRTGIVYAPGSPLLVAGTSSTSPWTVTVAPGHFVGSKGNSNGPYYACNDGTVTVNLTAPPASNSRIDVIYAVQQDSAAIVNPDGSTAAVIGVATGTPGATPNAVAVGAVGGPPYGSVVLGQVQIASTATAGTSGANVTITTSGSTTGAGDPIGQYTVPRSDPIPVRNATERNALTAFSGANVYRLDTGAYEYSDGTTWYNVGGKTTRSWDYPRPSDGTFGAGVTTGLVSGVITGAPAGAYRLELSLILRSTVLAGGAIYIYAGVNPAQTLIRTGTADVPVSPNPRTIAVMSAAYTHPGGDMLITGSANIGAGTTTVTAVGSYITAYYLGPQ